MYRFRAIIEKDESGYYVASIPAVPGCHTQGNSMKEAISGIKEALELCLEEAEDNPAYKAQIDFPDQNVSREFKVVEIEVQENA